SVVAEPAAEISVDMGVAQVLPHELAVSVGGQTFSPAVAVLMPNPHAVTLTAAPPADLSVSPRHHPEQVLAQGANYEFVTVHSRDHISMRVYERGVGETASCGTGACAAAVVAAQQCAGSDTWTLRVDVPGGRLQVHCDARGHLHLQGPAQITESGFFEFAADGQVTIGERVDVGPAHAPHAPHATASRMPQAPESAQ
ncbi:MAG: hypothetical protein EB027_02245, partial [Actinobacteria bacterium]|nr:hypothetical protein [Actinomycetota bacterium]